jgi:hypothetical protein
MLDAFIIEEIKRGKQDEERRRDEGRPRLEIPIELTNVGAGHRVPAGFSQEREIWVELVVKDARGLVVYEVGKIADDNADLRDKIFTRVTTRDDVRDFTSIDATASSGNAAASHHCHQRFSRRTRATPGCRRRCARRRGLRCFNDRISKKGMRAVL